tara:strand:- start:647 stop:850 length:204 start_codon:yes stop_codon:yes gene_type:complete
MKVKELIEFLKTQPQELPVCFRLCSEQCMLEVSDISIEKLCEARPDGWVENERPDKKSIDYLVFPGN